MNQIRFMQGDIQGKNITSLPKGAIKISQRPIALGSHSGHQHCITGDVDLYEFEGKTYAVVGNNGACLQHVHSSNFKESMYKNKKKIHQADHKAIDLETGTYEFFIQNAYNPFKKVFEKVQD